MKCIGRGAFVAAGLLLATAGLSGAQDRSKGTEGEPGRSPSGPTAASSKGAVGAGAGAQNPANDDCTHQMTGTVKDLDKARGTLEIQIAGEEPLRIHLPTSEMSGFEEGDEVVVSMGVKERRPVASPEP
jgi:hypothetical protein